jgi:hypothetical protein
MKPKMWGKYFWTTLHLAAMGYPDSPTIEDKETYRAFYTNFGRILPCYKCSINYMRHLTELPIDESLLNSVSLFNWTISLHNVVNRELGKPQWNLEYARMHYTNIEQSVSSGNSLSGWNGKYALIGIVTINVILAFLVLRVLVKNVGK